VAQKVGAHGVAGFAPQGVNKSGLFELHSGVMAAAGLPALPAWHASRGTRG